MAANTLTSRARRLPVPLAAITALVRPIWTARRTDHASLGAAYGVHLFGVWLFAEAVMLLASVTRVIYPGDRPSWSYADWMEIHREVIESFTDREELFAILLVFLMLEVCYIGLAWLLTPWAARPERRRQTFRRTLKRMWLVTPWAGTVLLVTMTGIMRYDAARRHYFASLADAQYQVTAPIYYRLEEIVYTTTSLLCGLWVLWVLLCVARDGVWGVRCRWPAVCEGCGYTLHGYGRGDSCPECGQSVAASTCDTVRCGSVWDRRREVGRVRAWWRSGWEPMLRPRQFGRTLRVYTPAGGCGRLWVVNTCIITLVAAVLIPASFAAWSWMFEEMDDFVRFVRRGEFLMVFAAFTAIIVSVCALWPLLSAALIGWVRRGGDGPSPLAAAMQAACHLHGYILTLGLVFWAAFFGICIYVGAADINPGNRVMGIEVGVLFGCVLIGILAVGAIVYLSLLHLITRATRFANT